MIESFKDYLEEFRDYDTELLVKILNETSIKTKNSDAELFVDENWKINSKNMKDIT